MRRKTMTPPERRPTVTVDLGPDGISLLDHVVGELRKLDPVERGAVGIKPWITVTRSTVIRLALCVMSVLIDQGTLPRVLRDAVGKVGAN